ncbi:MAG: hypothetical protein IKT45_05450 [Lachnospiraceae bacterium]|nr:hypothetical protein [Lachnospiraceae bacterium]
MNNTELLSAISNLLDTKLDEKLDARFDAFEKKLDAKLEAKFEEKLSPIYHRLDSLEYRMGNVEELSIATHKTLTENVIPRLDRMENRLERVETRLDCVETRLERVETRLDCVETRLERVETRLDCVETRLERVETRLDCVEKKAHDIGLILENDIQPRLRHIESCYVDTFKRYVSGIENQETLQFDVDTLKRTVRRHSMILQKFAFLPS